MADESLTVEQLHQLVAEYRDKAVRAKELFDSLFENNHSVMLLIDPESGAIRDANAMACRYYGYSKARMAAMHIMDINVLSPEQVREEMQNAELARRNYFNFHHRLANGEIREVEVSSGPITINKQKLLYSIIHDISRRRKVEREKEQLIVSLEKALAEIKTLRGILPICCSCKKIRDDKGYWRQIEIYIKEHSGAEFSHGICPECIRKLYPDFDVGRKDDCEKK